MHDPKPVQLVAIACVCAVGWLAVWWTGLPVQTRMQYLTQIARAEGATSRPPVALWPQVAWLAGHRWQWLLARLALVGLVVVMGLLEGVKRRCRDPHGGFLHGWWTVGVIGLAVCVGLTLGLCVYPWPLVPSILLPVLLGGWGLAAYGLAAGRPHIG